MKSATLLLSLLLSVNVFAARLPTYDEGIKLFNEISNNDSVADIIKIVKNDKLDLVSELHGDFIKRSGRSAFAARIILNRLNPDNPKGNLNENLTLLDLIINKGVDVNIRQGDSEHYGGTDFWSEDQTLMLMASESCSLDTIKYLQKKGADISADTYYWGRALHQAAIRQDSTNCQKATEYLIDNIKELDYFTLRSFLFTQDHSNLFIYGNDIDESLTDSLREKIFNLTGITFSKKPNSDEPSLDWFNDFRERLGKPYGGAIYGTYDWWNSQDEDHKAWACYLSTFDEALAGLHKLGISDDYLMENGMGAPWIRVGYSDFLVKVFTPYCNSIK